MSFRATVESMSKIMDDMGITELNLERQFLFGVYRKHIHLSKQQVAAAVTVPATDATTHTETKKSVVNGYALKSPMVGVVYLSADPNSPNYVKVGDNVNEGDTVCLIEAMKTFNPVKAHKAGKVSKILVSGGDPVEYGEPLIIIE